MSLRGKWTFIKSKLPTREAAEHLDYIDRKFSEHVFESGELRKVIERAVQDYLKSLDAIENKLLVIDSRADIAELDTRAGEWLPFAVGDKMFATEYRQMIDEVVADVSRETKLTAGRDRVADRRRSGGGDRRARGRSSGDKAWHRRGHLGNRRPPRRGRRWASGSPRRSSWT